jgi:very-short-patch-repair endonuclease
MSASASPDTHDFARMLRQDATWAERSVWDALRAHTRGVKFRRQHPIGRYVVDFYCHGAALVVELDGNAHNDREHKDAARDEWLRYQGLMVLRFANAEWKNDRASVLGRIDAAVAARILPGAQLAARSTKPVQVPGFAKRIVAGKKKGK